MAGAAVVQRERQNIVIKSYLIVPRLMKLFLRSICILVYMLKFNFVAAGAIGGRLFFGIIYIGIILQGKGWAPGMRRNGEGLQNRSKILYNFLCMVIIVECFCLN